MNDFASPGTVVGGKYRVDHVLGEGGMGIVVAATDLALERRVALKFMLPKAAKNEEGRERFLREARASVGLTSQHVARVFDVGTTSDGAPYIVMELLEGSDLAAVREHSGRLPVDLAVDLVVQACDAVAEAHAQSIVHRDLKPQNLFVTRRANGRPLVKVLDFGISKVLQAGVALTRTRSSMGSPIYMAPEQMRSARAVDTRADIWAIGVILFELVCGRPPFVGESVPEIALMIAQDPVPDPRTFRPELPEGLARVILHCLQKEPSERYASVEQLVADLAPYGPNATGTGMRLPMPSGSDAEYGARSSALVMPPASGQLSGPLVIAPVSTEASWQRTRGGVTGSPPTPRAVVAAVIAASALATIGAVGGAAYFVLHASRASAPAAAAASSATTLVIGTEATVTQLAPIAPDAGKEGVDDDIAKPPATGTAMPAAPPPPHLPKTR
jgi:serine/threonine-protein kinase